MCVSWFIFPIIWSFVLCKQSHPYYLVPMTDEPNQLLHFSIHIDSTVPFHLQLLDNESHGWCMKSFDGQWRGKSAGGCRHHLTWRNNPQYFLKISEPTTVLISLSQPNLAAQHRTSLASIGFYVCLKGSDSSYADYSFQQGGATPGGSISCQDDLNDHVMSSAFDSLNEDAESYRYMDTLVPVGDPQCRKMTLHSRDIIVKTLFR